MEIHRTLGSEDGGDSQVPRFSCLWRLRILGDKVMETHRIPGKGGDGESQDPGYRR